MLLPGFWKEKKSEPEGRQLLEQALPFLVSFFLGGAGLLMHWVVAASTVGLWPPQASHNGSAALTIAMAALWFLAPTASRMKGGRQIKDIAKKKIVIWADTMRKMLMSFPMRMLGLRPCISMESQSSSK
jgi:hypothetical protein